VKKLNDMPIYSIEIIGLNRLVTAFKQAPQLVVKKCGEGIKNSVHMIRPIMKQEAPIGKPGGGKGHPGMLRRSIYARYANFEGEVGPDLAVTPYAYYVHEGTRPYDIRPKTKKALFWKGASHPVKVVHHPGIRANPFVARTAEKVTPMVNAIFGKIADDIVNKLAK
jgi:hypothetical protein